jgi:hypothetical protein
VIILLTKLHRLIGRKSPKVSGDNFLGMSNRSVDVKLLGIGTPAKKSPIACTSSPCIIDQQDVKNFPE